MAKGLIKRNRPHLSLEAPVTALRRHMDQFFEDFANESRASCPWPARWGVWDSQGFPVAPSVDVSETDDAIEVTADLPGMDENDVEVTLDEGLLTIRGEKKEEQQEKKRHYRVTERSYGSFERVLSLPRGMDLEHAKARFKKGVLTVVLPKTQEARTRQRKIEVASE